MNRATTLGPPPLQTSSACEKLKTLAYLSDLLSVLVVVSKILNLFSELPQALSALLGQFVFLWLCSTIVPCAALVLYSHFCFPPQLTRLSSQLVLDNTFYGALLASDQPARTLVLYGISSCKLHPSILHSGVDAHSRILLQFKLFILFTFLWLLLLLTLSIAFESLMGVDLS